MKCVNKFTSSEITAYSLCGRFLALCNKNKLIISNTNNFSLNCVFNAADIIDKIVWSRDCSHVLCLSKNTVEVFALKKHNWVCCIRGGEEETEDAEWSPDGKHILTLSGSSVRIRIWCLDGKSKGAFEISRKFSKNILTYSKCGSHMVVSPKEDERTIKVINTSTWKHEKNIVNNFQLTDGPIWNPIEKNFVLYITTDFRICDVAIFSAKTGKLVGHFKRERSKKLKAVRSVSWSHSGQLIAIGCYDGAIFILDHIVWTPLIKFQHTSYINNEDCCVFQMRNELYNEIQIRPINLTIIDRKLFPVTPGVKYIAYDHKMENLASVDECMPAVVWIWKIKHLKLACMLILKENVTSIAWSRNGRLAIIDGSHEVIIWDGELPEVVNAKQIHSEKDIGQLIWRPGKHKPQLLLISNKAVHILEE